MRKFLFLTFAVCSLALAMSSCKKERTCVCQDASGNKTESKLDKASKKDQEKACDALSSIASIGGGSCKLD